MHLSIFMKLIFKRIENFMLFFYSLNPISYARRYSDVYCFYYDSGNLFFVLLVFVFAFFVDVLNYWFVIYSC